jgi:hypothetical protein
MQRSPPIASTGAQIGGKWRNADLAPSLRHPKRPRARCACGNVGTSSSSGDRAFELDLGGEAVAIPPDRQHRQLPAAMLVRHDAVLRFEPAVNLDPVPLPGMADIGEQQVSDHRGSVSLVRRRH